MSNQCSFNKASSEDIYKRDLVWSALKVIKLLVEKDNFEEAERLLERITGCNGLCNDPCYTNKPCGCGCGHWIVDVMIQLIIILNFTYVVL